ncbi:MAG: hypothetical protein ABIQ16_13700 [Polyangiaceae bacterium]
MRVRLGPKFGSYLTLGVSLSWIAALAGCGGSPATGARTGGGAEGRANATARIELREVDDHPPINLVVRLGDPLPAVAFASAHDGNAVASVALSALVLARLRARGLGDVVSIPTQGGIELAVLCADVAAARAFIEQVTTALSTPVAERDDAIPVLQEHLTALRSRAFAGPAEATVAECSGELGLLLGAAIPDLRTPVGRAELEKYRQFAFASRASAFAALGSNEFVNAAASELEKAPAWPSGDAALDPWPTADLINADVLDGRRRLSVALRVADAEAALSAVPVLSGDGGSLASRLRSFLPGYSIERVAFQARPRGACLRVDLGLPEGAPGPAPKEAAQAASLVSEEMRAALPSAERAGALEENIVEPADPRQAAARAAWRALTGRQEASGERRFVALAVHPTERATFSGWASVLSDFETRPTRAPLETRLRAEPGQGELWVLLGSPCGTLGESNDDAGQSALALTLAARATTADVALEPWLTTDSVGLLAHAPRMAGESPNEQAERVARALARALTDRGMGGDALAVAQRELFASVGSAPRPGYARLLDALAPEHVAWLEPRGSWASLALANRDSVSARGRDLLRGPLRVAVLANQDEAQAVVAAHALERWFAPWRDDPRRCQATTERGARSGEISLSVPDGANTESAYVGVPFPSRLKFEREAEAFAAFLNTPGGPLSRALSDSALNASARASIIGGGRAGALLIEIHCNDDDARKAALEVRKALDRAVSGQLSNEELAAAQRAAAQRALASSLDPRRRIVDLWRGTASDPSLTRNSLRGFQAALSGAAQVVVYVTHRD